MASIGPRLQEARLRKGLTLERIADDTNIALRFLAKLERDDFEGFPGEPYIVGFIRNYAEYLGLDAQAFVADYRAAEAPPPEAAPSMPAGPQAETAAAQVAPREPSLGSETGQGSAPAPSPAPLPTAPAARGRERPPARHLGRLGLLLSVLSVLIVAAAAFWVIAGGFLSSPRPKEGPKAPAEYRVEGSPFEKRLYVGDSLLVPLGESVYKLSLAGIDEKVQIDTPFGRQSLGLGETGFLDPDSDGHAEASIAVADFERRRPGSGALLDLNFAAPASAAAPGEVTVPGTAAETKPASGQAAADKTLVFKSSRGPYPFVVQVSFRGSCLFRYEADRKEWVEKYSGKGETITINVNSALTVWSSNAQAAKLSFQASGGKLVDLELGAPGEIAVKRIFWDNYEGSWALVSSSLD